jgi:hypothetical protein
MSRIETGAAGITPSGVQPFSGESDRDRRLIAASDHCLCLPVGDGLALAKPFRVGGDRFASQRVRQEQSQGLAARQWSGRGLGTNDGSEQAAVRHHQRDRQLVDGQ